MQPIPVNPTEHWIQAALIGIVGTLVSVLLVKLLRVLATQQASAQAVDATAISASTHRQDEITRAMVSQLQEQGKLFTEEIRAARAERTDRCLKHLQVEEQLVAGLRSVQEGLEAVCGKLNGGK